MKSIEGRWGTTYYLENDIYIAPSLENYGEFSPEETEMIISLATEAGKNRLCLDIGSNFGCISQALEVAGFTCEAFEPQPNIVKVTAMNVKGVIHNAAVGSCLGETIMPLLATDTKVNHGGVSVGKMGELGSIKVPVVAIDALEYPDVGFMKIDVEGFELEVLKGATETIKRCRPIIYLEDDRKENSPMLRKYIWDLGYRTKLHQPPLFRPNNFFKNEKSIWKENIVSFNIICRPL
jgi:FkbM family methyltransferase